MRIALGMSGGVDSSLCAHLLKEQGHEVVGVFLECWRAPGCRVEEDRADALKVALSLGIPFQVLDFKQVYKNKVVEYFFDEYEAGRTPNPDVLCNKEIKFGLFYDWAIENGFDAIATGHYAKTNDEGELLIPVDKHKDQTYFLYLLQQNQLKHTVFPLADMTKSQVRAEAKKRKLHVSDKPDSTGICFIGEIDVRAFLKERLGEKPGKIIDTKGRVLGEHKGLWFYTIGQRHGFEVDKKTAIKLGYVDANQKEVFPVLYVIGKNAEKNQLIVGRGGETLRQEFPVSDIHWIGTEPKKTTKLLMRIRHTGDLLPGELSISDNGKGAVTLNQPARGIAEGQSVVFYSKLEANAICLGGGIITH